MGEGWVEPQLTSVKTGKRIAVIGSSFGWPRTAVTRRVTMSWCWNVRP